MIQNDVQRYVFFGRKTAKGKKYQKTSPEIFVSQIIIKKENKNGKKFFSINKI